LLIINTGIGLEGEHRAGKFSGIDPATGAIAVIFLDNSQPSRKDIMAPLEIPVE
jgi:hypothetical protein